MLERLQAVQLEKLTTPEAQLFWRRLRKTANEEETHEASLVREIDATGVEEIYLALGDVRITADAAAVVSLGMSYGEIKTVTDLKNMKDAADETQTASKEEIHEAMGGAYRSAQEVKHGFRAVPVQWTKVAFQGLRTWAMRRRIKVEGSE